MNWEMNWDWFLFMYIALVFGVPALVVWASYSEIRITKQFDLRELWLHQGRVDKFAVIILGTWWTHTCSLLLWTLLQSVTTADYVTYMGWAIPIMAKMWAPKNGAPPVA